MNPSLTVKMKSKLSAENKPGWRIQTSCGSEMNHLEVIQFMCTWRYEHISTYSVIWQLYFTCRNYFSLFSAVNQICDIWYTAQYTPNVSPVANYAQCLLSQNAVIVISKTFRKIHVVSYILNKVWFYCGVCWFSHSGESPLGCFPSWLAERPQSLSYPQSEVHALLDKKMNATAMGSIIINERWHHRVVR